MVTITFILLVVVAFILLVVTTFILPVIITFILLVVKFGHLGRRELQVRGGPWSVVKGRLVGLRTEEALIRRDGRVERDK